MRKLLFPFFIDMIRHMHACVLDASSIVIMGDTMLFGHEWIYPTRLLPLIKDT
jgi:hypothetical protein